jgi:hypothetical protein
MMYSIEYNVTTSIKSGNYYFDGASCECLQVLCDIHVLWCKVVTKFEG